MSTTRTHALKHTMKMRGGRLARQQYRQWKADMDRQIAACRSVCVTLPTLNELERFWADHRGEYAYAIEGQGGDLILAEHEWIFGNTPLAVIRAYNQRREQIIDKAMAEVPDDIERYDRAKLDEAVRYWRGESAPLDDALGNVIEFRR